MSCTSLASYVATSSSMAVWGELVTSGNELKINPENDKIQP